MNVLLATNHVAEFSGSEIVIFELAIEMLSAGYAVDVTANFIADPLRSHFPSEVNFVSPADVDIENYHIVWSQHDMVANFIGLHESYTRYPLIVMVSLSPFEPLEFPDLLMRQRFSAPLFTNSPETRDHLLSRDHHGMTTVFHNACPAHYFGLNRSKSSLLRKIAIISNHHNHITDEISGLLTLKGIEVRRIGIHHDYKLVSSEDIRDVDAVITIGKTVIYAIAAGVPVFIYDVWGGSGWLTAENFAKNEYYNFSGRPDSDHRSSTEIVDEIVSGFVSASDFSFDFAKKGDLTRFKLSTYVAQLGAAASNSHGRALFSGNVKNAIADHGFRLHLEMLKAKNRVIGREYVHARRPRR